MRMILAGVIFLTACSAVGALPAVEFRGHDGPVLIEYYLPQCPHCRAMMPVVDDVQRLYNQMKVVRVDGSGLVNSVPTFALYKEGALLATWTGELSRAEFHAVLREAGIRYIGKEGDYSSLASPGDPARSSDGHCLLRGEN